MSASDIRSLDIGMLRTFEALLHERSVSRAAARLFLSQSAVSSTLKRLRECFADPLFTRTAHGVEPTPQALLLAPHVQAALAEIGKLLSVGQAFDPARSDRIFRIHGSDHMSERVLPPLCAELSRLGSGIRLQWEHAHYGTASALVRGDVDLALLPRFVPPEGLLSDVLYEDHHVLAARPGLLPDTVSLPQFCATPQIILGYGRSTLEDMVEQIVARAGLQRVVQVALSGFAQILSLLAHGQHCAILPRRLAQRHGAQLSLHALPFELPPYRLHLCASLRSENDSALQWLRERIRQQML